MTNWKRTLLRTLLVLAIAAPALYLAVMLLNFANRPYITETAVTATMTDSVYCDGAVVFEEQTLASGSGEIGYLVADGIRVSAGTQVAEQYTDAAQAQCRKQLQQVEEEIRLLQMPRVWSRTPQRNVKAVWAVCSPKTVGRFSAVAYLVARDLAARLNVPIGVIDISWGGCRIEAMTTRQAFRKASVNDEVAAAAEREFVKLDKTADPDLRKDKQRLPGVLYNAMVHPLTPMAVRGMLWYQGEDNHSESMRYAEKLKALAYAWRQAFCKEDLPIFIVQLPPWQYGNEDPVRIPKFWEAQQFFAEHDKNAGFIVATDCGDPADIHPKDKAPLAARLANLVLFKEYGLGDDSVLAPVFRRARRVDGAVEIEFDHANGLKTRDGKGVSHLMLAGADGKFHPATGEIRDGRLIVRSAEVPLPKLIRFGWDKLANPNLVNRAGVPAAPFEKRIP